MKAAIKRRALSGEKTAQQILSQELSDTNEDTAVNLPAIRDKRKNIRGHRQNAGNPIPVPLTSSALVIPEDLQRTNANGPFLLYDRILIFATAGNLDLLQSADKWFCDGTFKIFPKIFYQFFQYMLIYMVM